MTVETHDLQTTTTVSYNGHLQSRQTDAFHATRLCAHAVLDHAQQCVVVDEGCTHNADVEELVAAGPRVEFAGEESLGNTQHVDYCPEDVHTSHYY